MSIQKFALAMKVIGEIINDLPANRLKTSIAKMNAFYGKFLEASAKAKLNPIEIGGHARCMSYIAQDIQKATQEIATASSAKEQHDYAVEQAPQMNENFLAIVEGRAPIKKEKSK